MCYSALVKQDLDFLGRRFGAIAVRVQIEDFLRDSARNPKRFPPLMERIFPGHYAPVIFKRGGEKVIELMRYGAYPPPSVTNSARYTTFNARRDNLTSSFWSNAFLRHHGCVIIEGFYEWVAVQDLLKAGVVTLGDVESEFKRQAEERKAKILAQGKKYKPTPTELKSPLERQIIIEFKPRDGRELLVPVIFSQQKLEDGNLDKGFAIVTDEPLPDIEQAGHDRSPVILSEDAINEWLNIEGASARQMDGVLARAGELNFSHALPAA